jgi:enterochelin esterase-like enzyme
MGKCETSNDKMKLKFWSLVVIGILAAGCQAATPVTVNTATPYCGEAGTVTVGEVSEASRGYGYAFNIYLPPCYEDAPEAQYPVIYLLPGRGSGPGAWFAAGANVIADEVIENGSVPPFILVTTENTDSEPHADSILNDLVPYIDSQYRTLEARDYRAVGGGSLGGIGAYRLGWQHPELFSSIGIFGSGVISGEEAQVQTWLKGIEPQLRPRVFINCGFQDELMLDRAKVTVDLLAEAGIPATTIYGEGAHTYEYWAKNLPAYFKWVAEGW